MVYNRLIIEANNPYKYVPLAIFQCSLTGMSDTNASLQERKQYDFN